MLRPLFRRYLPLILIPLGVWGVGCSLSGTKNYTPGTLPASATQLYPFEVAWNSARRDTNPEHVQAFVMLDGRLYPMNRVPVTKDRWEAKIPIADGRMYVPYQFKFEYSYPGLTGRITNSVWSQPYRLVIPQ